MQAGSRSGEMTSGMIKDTRFTGTTVAASSAAGDATPWAGAVLFNGSITNSVVRGNHVRASSPNESASVAGGGLVQDDAALMLRDTTVSENTGDANGPTGTARGGGILDAAVPDGPTGGPLYLTNSRVTRNTLSGGASITRQGGGVFTTEPVTLTNSVIAHNSPDQCSGC